MSYRLFVGLLERYRSGYNGPDSKSGWLNSHVGSNPTLSAKEDLGFTNYDFRFKNPKSKIINRKFDGERWPSG